MPAAVSCPDLPTLRRLLLGLGDDATTDHVSSCPACGERMRAVPAEDGVVAAVRAAKSLVQEAEPPLLRALVPLLKCLRPRDATATWLYVNDAGLGGVTYSFLRPTGAAGDLGRLGPYRILEVLGAGGMGVVFRARDDRLERDLAVKVIRPGLHTKAGAVERFLAEARAAAAVEHDHIVPVYQADEQDGTPYLAMPLLRGESLDARLRREAGPLPAAEVLRIGRETALGLAAAHDRGLTHRDIKPANLWLEAPAGRVKLLDFGLAAAVRPGDECTLEIAGTPAYMAPEQTSGKPVDGRADLFSLGCVLYRAATGRVAFDGADTLSTLFRVVNDDPPPPRDLNPKLPPALAALIVALLAKRPDGRPASARDVAATLAGMENPPRSWLSRRGWLLATGASTAAAGVGLWAWLGEKNRPRPEPQPQPFVGEVRKHEMHQRAVTAVALVEGKAGRRVLSASRDQRVWVWNPDSDDQPTPLRLNRDGSFFDVPLLAMAVTTDGTRAAVGGGDKTAATGNRFRLWDVAARKEMELPIGSQQGLIQALAFDPKGELLVEGRSDGTVSVWGVASGKARGGYADPDPKRHNMGVRTVAVAPTGDYALAGGGDGSVIVLGLKPVAHRKTHPDAHADGVTALAFLPDGRGFVSAGGDGSVRVWDRDDGSRVFRGHERAVTGVAVSGDGSRVVSGGEDGTLRVWATATGDAVRVPAGPAVRCVAVTADGRHAVTGGTDGAVRFWQLP